MPMTMISGGYGGRAKINNCYVMLTSYNLSMKSNYIHSSAVGRIFNGTKFTRQSLNALYDFEEYDLSMSFDATKPSLNMILDAIIEHPHQTLPVSFVEMNYGLSYTFPSANISSVSVKISENSLCSVDVSFAVFNMNVDVVPARFEPPKNFNSEVMPYYCFRIDGNFGYNGILGFGFTIQQSIERRFGCQGLLDSDNRALYYVFGKQETSYNISCLDKGNSNVRSGSASSNTLDVICCGKTMLKFSDWIVESVSPELVDPSGHRSFDIQGSVLGGTEFTPL